MPPGYKQSLFFLGLSSFWLLVFIHAARFLLDEHSALFLSGFATGIVLSAWARTVP